jgi:5-carboxymethyl-2-hydroxymuconate isomerase
MNFRPKVKVNLHVRDKYIHVIMHMPRGRSKECQPKEVGKLVTYIPAQLGASCSKLG